MDFYDAIRIKALRDVFKGDDPSYILRRIYRWYSTTFHVPLPDIDALPLNDILQHYFENYFESLSNDKRLKEINKLFAIPDVEKLSKEAAEDEEFLKNLKTDLQKEKEKRVIQEANKKTAFEKAKNQNIIRKLGNSPDADKLKRFIETEDSLSPIKK